MKRFLQYSLIHNRPIRIVFMLKGTPVQKTATVLSIEEETVSLKIGSKKQQILLPVCDILSCAYARGDNGED